MTRNTTTLCCHRVVVGVRASWRWRRWWIVVLAVVICSTDVSEESNHVNVANALQQPIKSSSSSSSSTSSSSISSTQPRKLKAQLPPPISSSSSQPSSTILDHVNSASAATTATSRTSPLKASSLADDIGIMDSSSSDTITATSIGISSSSSSLADEITRNLQKRTTVGVDDSSSNDSDSSSSNAQLAIWKLAAAGAVATVIGDVSIHPIDSIKTLQQSDEGFGMSLGTAAYIMYSQFGGISAFYKGFLTYGICDGIGGALKFATYEGLKRQTEQRLGLVAADDDRIVENEQQVANNMDKETLLQILLFVFAGMSFVVSSIVTVPGELLKQHLQMGHYVGFWDALTAIVQSSDGSGIAGLYTGYDGVFVRDVPYTAMELGLYDLFKTIYVMEQLKKQQQQQDDSSPVQTSAADFPLKTSEQLLIAGLTGGVAGFLTTPFDTVKTKLMVDVDFAGMSFWDATMVTVHDHGVAALFCGALARVAWLVPNTAIYLPTYDFLKNKLQEMDISSTSTTSKDEVRI